MKKIILGLAVLALLPVKSFAENFTAADCLGLEAMINYPQIANTNSTMANKSSTQNGYASSSSSSETPEQRLERRKIEITEQQNQRNQERLRRAKSKKISAQIDEQVDVYVADLKTTFTTNSCETKIEQINDKMGCLSLKLTIEKLQRQMGFGFGYKNTSPRMSSMNSSRNNGRPETEVEKQMRELNEQEIRDQDQFDREIQKDVDEAQAEQQKKDEQIQSRIKILMNAGRNNCKDKFTSLPAALELKKVEVE